MSPKNDDSLQKNKIRNFKMYNFMIHPFWIYVIRLFKFLQIPAKGRVVSTITNNNKILYTEKPGEATKYMIQAM
jgi:hypothetical protein